MRKSLSVLGGVVLAVVLSQFPEYAQQYTQRLGGAVDELRGEVERIDAEAAGNSLTRAQYLERYTGNVDPIFVRDGENKVRLIGRYDQLSAALLRVQGAGPVERLVLLPSFLDSEIGGRTLDNFKPAVPVAAEGFLYAGGGFVIGYALVWALGGLLLLPFRRRRYRYRTTET